MHLLEAELEISQSSSIHHQQICITVHHRVSLKQLHITSDIVFSLALKVSYNWGWSFRHQQTGTNSQHRDIRKAYSIRVVGLGLRISMLWVLNENKRKGFALSWCLESGSDFCAQGFPLSWCQYLNFVLPFMWFGKLVLLPVLLKILFLWFIYLGFEIVY